MFSASGNGFAGELSHVRKSMCLRAMILWLNQGVIQRCRSVFGASVTVQRAAGSPRHELFGLPSQDIRYYSCHGRVCVLGYELD